MSEAIEPMLRLETFASELDTLSKQLGATERELVPVEAKYEHLRDSFETGLWEAHVKADAKLPSEAMRLRLFHKQLDPQLLGEHAGLIRKRKRLQERIGALKAAVSAQQSILSALKVEAEATGAGMRRAA